MTGTIVLHRVTTVLLGSWVPQRYAYESRHRNYLHNGIECVRVSLKLGVKVIETLRQLWNDDRGQDVAEYAVMLAVILVIVIGTVRLIGGNANNVFSQVSSSMSQ